MAIFSLTSLALALPLLAFASYWIPMAIYRLFFHPLRKFPGPFLAALTNQYFTYYSWTGDVHLDMTRCHEKYGDFVRYGPDRLLINTPEAVKAIYSTPNGVKKSHIYAEMVHGTPGILTMTDLKQHAYRRRVMSQGFSEAALRQYDEAICGQIEKLCTVFSDDCQNTTTAEEKSKGWGTAMNMAHWCNYLFFDIMSTVVFGQDYNLVGSQKSRYVTEAIERSNLRMGVIVANGNWKFLGLDKWLFPEAIKGRNLFLRFVGGLLSQNAKRDDTPRNDVISTLLKIRDPITGQSMSPTQLGAEAVTLIVAGADTSSTSFAAALFYLSRHKDVYDKLAEEVRGNFGDAQHARAGTVLNACVYLRSCIEEAMRMSPPVGGPMWREVTSNELTINGKHIPVGCDVGTGCYSIQHHKDIFYDPFEYIPERWAAKESLAEQEAQQVARSVYTPFSVGPRGCIGRSLAMREMTLAMATILLKFDFRVAEGPSGKIGEGHEGLGHGRTRASEFQLYEHITSAKNGPFLQFKLRK